MLYSAMHWGSFLSDMGDQFRVKFERNIFRVLTSPLDMELFLLLLLCFIVILKNDPKSVAIPVLALSARLAHAVGQEMFYGFYTSVAYLCLSLSLLHVVSLLLDRLPQGLGSKFRLLFQGSAVGCILMLNISTGMLSYPLMGEAALTWSGMYLPKKGAAPYITETDKNRVKSYLEAIGTPEAPVYVQFRQKGDSLLFEDLHGDSIKLY